MSTENIKYTHRFLARIILQTETALAVGSGEKDIFSDKLIARDVNNLPYIPGSALAGIIRHTLGKEKSLLFFGYGAEDDPVEKLGKGSEIIFSAAHILDENQRVIEGFYEGESEYLRLFENLPVRQHVAIDERGVNKRHGKFDEEVVYKGTRFGFEIEMLSDGTNEGLFTEVLDCLAVEGFRIGSGTRKGLGEVSVIECKKVILDLTKKEDREAYLLKSSSLNDSNFWQGKTMVIPKKNTGNWTVYRLVLHPDDFFLFGSGFGDNEADMTPVEELVIEWNKEEVSPQWNKNYILIPGTSVKGAISHRVAFHYNKLKKYFVGDVRAKIGVDNQAVKDLFGFTIEKTEESRRGNVIFSDIFRSRKCPEDAKILNHVAIDRFTGGAMEGALFSEEVVNGKGQEYEFEILVNKEAFQDSIVKKAFEATLNDIVSGMLPLGGGVNRGNGCFTGKWKEI